MQTWSNHLLRFYKELRPPESLPGNCSWLHPQKNPEVLKVMQAFYKKYYNDRKSRAILIGINPGRFGAGVTGVNFTAPRQLTSRLNIPHSFRDHSELSAEFIYEVADAYGGPHKFFGDCFIGSVCPLGLVKDGKNINYYDDRQLLGAVEPFIISSLNRLFSIRHAEVCIVVGGGKNYNYFSRLNKEHKWFRELQVLPHPRFIMQYRRKTMQQFVGEYVSMIKRFSET